MFSQTLAHGNSNNEITEEGKTRGMSMERSKADTKIGSPHGLTIARAYRPTGSLSPEAVDDITQLIYTYIIHPLLLGGQY